ncbi:MAG: hypothetical protein CSA75_02865 [Sorangium cellulosum]|nr:MAG: hypothetical protein CSA75_02865 [Sorangium cellulosum]
MADEEVSFKKGSLGVKFVLLALGIAALAIGLVYLGIKREGEKLTIEQVVNEQKRIFKLEKAQQLPEWRKWAVDPNEFEMRQQSLLQIGWLEDKESIPLLIQALEQDDHRLRGVAAQVISHFGSPAADAAKPILKKALEQSDPSDEPQIAWALVELNDKPSLDRILRVYRAGHLAKVQRIGGGSAFDPEKLAKMAAPEKWMEYVKDESASVRQLVATILSANAEPKYTDALITLVQDKDVDVAREAAPGLGKIGDEKSRKPLLDALGQADKESRKKFLLALRDGIGGVGLVTALGSIDIQNPERKWHQTRVIFNMLKELADPRAGDALVKYIESTPSPHWKTEAAMRLAEIGDPRAVPYLAERMQLNTVKLYGDSELIEEKALARGDKERIIGARMLADLAKLYPDKVETFREQGEDAVLFWISDMPQPHANALRFLANVKSEAAREKLREWSFPKASLPREGQQPPMPQEWVVAQSALRYLGSMKDKPSWGKFLKQLDRRQADAHDVDVTMSSLMGGGLAILGMSLRALGVGVSDGFAEWGDDRAFDPLVEYIEDPKENEQSRVQACFALGWVIPKDKIAEIPEKIIKFAASSDDKDQFIAACYSETLARRSLKDFEEGRLYRFVRNAEAIRRVRVRNAPQEWACFLLGRQFDNLQFDNGPHSMTRVVLRNKLLKAAMTGEPNVRSGALMTLRFMKEQGVLMDLKSKGGEVGKEAGEALFLLMNPKVIVDVEAPDVKTGGSKILPSDQ